MSNVYETVMARALGQIDLTLTAEELAEVRKEYLGIVMRGISNQYTDHTAATLRQKILQDSSEDEAVKILIRGMLVEALKTYFESKKDIDYFIRGLLGDIARQEIGFAVVREMDHRRCKEKLKAHTAKRKLKAKTAKGKR